MRAELNRIAAAEGSFLANGSLDNCEVQSLLDDLSGFSRRDAYLTNPTITAAAGTNTTYNRGSYDACRKKGQSDDVVSNQEQLQANVDTRLAQLDSAIELGVNSGYISWTQARHLETELEHILDDEEHFTEDGRLSYREANQLIADLDALDAEVKALQVAYDRNRRARYGQRGQRNRNVASNLNLQQSVLRQRIQAGLRSGQLTKIEADRLFRSEDRIAELEAQMRESGGRLGYNEQRRLLAELDDLSHHITSELNDHHVQF